MSFPSKMTVLLEISAVNRAQSLIIQIVVQGVLLVQEVLVVQGVLVVQEIFFLQGMLVVLGMLLVHMGARERR